MGSLGVAGECTLIQTGMRMRCCDACSHRDDVWIRVGIIDYEMDDWDGFCVIASFFEHSICTSDGVRYASKYSRVCM